MSSALLFVCLFGCAFAQVPSLGRCPEVQTHPNFSLELYTGRWYEARRYFTVSEVASKCNAMDYSFEENGNLQMVNTGVTVLGEIQWKLNATARVPDRANPAKLKVKLSIDPVGIETDYWVLGTDYSNYAVVYRCINIKLMKYQQAWILTRERNPTGEVLAEAMEVARQNKLRVFKFIPTNQQNCRAT